MSKKFKGTQDKTNNLYGINLLKEDNYSAFNTELQYWDYDEGLPLKEGDTFPSDEMELRANINYTMNKLVNNELSEALAEYINTYPDLDPVTNRKIKDIMSALPVFNTIMRMWKLILRPCFKGVLIKGKQYPEIWKLLLSNIDEIITNKFTCCDRVSIAYRKEDRNVIKIYSDKNIILFRDANDDRIITISNVRNNGKGKKDSVEFLSYLPDGKVYRDEFEYNNGKLGNRLILNELVNVNNKIIFNKNGTGINEYGYPELVGCISAALGVIRAFNTLTYLNEKKRNVVTVVPDTAIRKDPYTGASALANGSVIAYDTVNPETSANNHDVKSESPQLKLEEVISTLDTMLKQVSLYSGLSGVILGYQTISGNDSGRAILASCVPTMLQANGYLDDIKQEVIDLTMKLCELYEEDITESDIKIIIEDPDTALLKIVNGGDYDTGAAGMRPGNT